MLTIHDVSTALSGISAGWAERLLKSIEVWMEDPKERAMITCGINSHSNLFIHFYWVLSCLLNSSLDADDPHDVEWISKFDGTPAAEQGMRKLTDLFIERSEAELGAATQQLPDCQ